MTTRKKARPLTALAALALVALASGGCATPGPLHVYSLATDRAEVVRDRGDGKNPDVPSFVADDERLTGFAYDPYTDHFFLRLAPGNRIRVVDRPARAIKREFHGEQLPDTGGGDLAIRPRDGHVFFAHPTQPLVFELTRLGKWVRTISLGATSRPAQGLAYDAERNRLFVRAGTAPARIAICDPEGHETGLITLDREIGTSLGYDTATREFYAPLTGPEAGLGVFDESGRLRRTHPANAPFIDVGPRSFVRVF